MKYYILSLLLGPAQGNVPLPLQPFAVVAESKGMHLAWHFRDDLKFRSSEFLYGAYRTTWRLMGLMELLVTGPVI